MLESCEGEIRSRCCTALNTLFRYAVVAHARRGVGEVAGVASSSSPAAPLYALVARAWVGLLDTIPVGSTSCTEYFDLLITMVGDAASGEVAAAGVLGDIGSQLLASVVPRLLSHRTLEERSSPSASAAAIAAAAASQGVGTPAGAEDDSLAEQHVKRDHLLHGLLRVARAVLAWVPGVRTAELGAPVAVGDVAATAAAAAGTPALRWTLDLMGFLFRHCLFGIPTRSCHGPTAPPMCKASPTRSAAYELLFTLVAEQPELYFRLSVLLAAQHPRASRHTVSWHYMPAVLQKSGSGYVGLRNLGATCYMK